MCKKYEQMTCRRNDILQDRQLLSTVVFTVGGDFMREIRKHSEGETEEARDPDPDVEARQDFWSIGKFTHFGIILHGTKVCVPKKRFSANS